MTLARVISKLEAYPVKYRGDRLLLSRPSSRALCVLKNHLLFWKNETREGWRYTHTLTSHQSIERELGNR